MNQGKLFSGACEKCGEDLPRGKLRCPSCGRWNIGRDHQRTQKLSEVESAQHHRLLLGKYTDVFGRGGLVSTSVTLYGGEPGAGKSTSVLEIMEVLGGGIYISGEEDPGEVRARADRVRLSPATIDNIMIVNALGDYNLEGNFREGPPAKCPILVVDSLSALCESMSDAKKFLRRVKAWASEVSTPVIVIDHSTKNDLLAGPRVYQHLVDTIVTLQRNENIRIMTTEKNRFGAECYLAFKMTETGFERYEIPVEDGTEDAGFVEEKGKT